MYPNQYNLNFDDDNPIGKIPFHNAVALVNKDSFTFSAPVLLMDIDDYIFIRFPDYLPPAIIDASRIELDDCFYYRHSTLTSLDTIGAAVEVKPPYPYGWVHKHFYTLFKPKTNSDARYILDSTSQPY